MPSPFPGMDPFIEGQTWQDFHTTFITVAREALTQQLRPNYIVNVEEFVYVVRESTQTNSLMKPDVAISESESRWIQPPIAGGPAVTIEPMVLTVPLLDRFEQHFLTIRKRKRQQVVTVIELLSPWNKTPEGRSEYLLKRNSIIGNRAHLVELDLLRAGMRLPTVEPLPLADYYTFVCRTERVPRVEVFCWRLPQPLPTVPVPLAGDDPDATLNLQGIFTTVYDRGGYDYALDYDLNELTPRLTGDEEAWAAGALRSQKPEG